jgi:amino acid adenylation domain-containing protein
MAEHAADVAELGAEQKRALLAQLLRKKAAADAAPQPLSAGQQALWILFRLAPRSPAYNFATTARLRTAVDAAAFRRAGARLIERHPLLRTTYQDTDAGPRQVLHPQVDFLFEQHQATDWSDEQWRERVAEAADRPFDLARGPVMRACLFTRAADDHTLVLTVHHIAADFWSLPILMDEIRRFYAAEVKGLRLDLPAPTGRYADFVRWQRDMLAGPQGESHWNWWRTQLSGELPTLDLPTDRPRPPVQTFRGSTHAVPLGLELTERLKGVSRGEGATLYMTLTAAFQTLLHRYTGQEDILVGTPMVGRPSAEYQNVLGYFANPVVLRANLAGDPSFQALLRQVRGTVLGAMEHQDYPFPTLVERLRPTRDASRSPLFQVMISWEKAQRTGEAAGPANTSGSASHPHLAAETLITEQRGAPFDLTLQVYEAADGLTVAFQYNADLFDQATIERMAGHFQTLLTGIADDPTQTIGQLPLLTEAERRQTVIAWNDTARDEPGEVCLHDLIAGQVARTPDARALVCEDQRLTYAELDRRANQLARRLQSLGVGPDVLVGVLMERSVEMVVALLGTIKAGGAYVPLDPEYPAERLAYMASDAQTPVLLTQERLLDRLPAAAQSNSEGEDGATNRPVTLCLDRDWADIAREGDAPVSAGTTPDHLAYVIYTSGSTGRPKGAMNTHRGISNRLVWMQRQYGLTADDRVLQKTPFSFDVSVWEFFWPLLSGATLVMARPGGHRDPLYLAELIERERVTTLHFVPSMLQLFLAAPGLERLTSLRRVICSGEALPLELQNQFFARFSCGLHNLYGPTEASVDVTYWECERGTRRRNVPIGRPIANTQLYVLDRHRQPLPIGVPGELHIGGVGLARGYWNKPELTAEKFIPDPFSTRPGARLYRTGDRCRWLADGTLEFLGRYDHQVKIRGNRIELGEIESVLEQHPAVREVVVVVRQDTPGEPRLAAYVVWREGASADVAALRAHLAERLPPYMQPASWTVLESMPLGPTGKVDRRALPAPERSREVTGTEYVAPRNETETLLARLWAEALELDRVGVEDEFFVLGGASSQAIQIVAQANAAGLPLTPEMFFRYPTIATLAEACEELQPALCNSRMESLGVYLPPKVVSTADVMAGCARPVRFPLERLTGIRNRHMAGDTEFAIDLSRKAMDECLARSAHGPADIEMLVCCNISRCDGPDHDFSFEPSTAAKLAREFGLRDALTFDVNNACSGMFTGVQVVDLFIRMGVIRRGMVVSGEYITHLTTTAQKEIEGHMDPRLACLTLGDAGAAVILERTTDLSIGFHEIELFTLGQYSHYCVAAETDGPHGGAIMNTDLLGVSSVITREGVAHWTRVAQRYQWSNDMIGHVIPHQVSRSTLSSGLYEAKNAQGASAARDAKVINNVEHRANTATTSYFLALWDHIYSGRINSGDKVLFGISGSGITIGTALYTLDDLPDRVRAGRKDKSQSQLQPPASLESRLQPAASLESQLQPADSLESRLQPADSLESRLQPALSHSVPSARSTPSRLGTANRGPRVAVLGVGIAPAPTGTPDSTKLAVAAAEDCLSRAGRDRREVGLIVHSGVYRTAYLTEPAVASMIGGALGLNVEEQHDQRPLTFAYDVINGSVGFMHACYAALQAVQFGRVKTALVTTSEIENNADRPGRPLMGLQPAGSAVLLGPAANSRAGFGRFHFATDPDRVEALRVGTVNDAGKLYLRIQRDPAIEDYCLDLLARTTSELLAREGLSLADIQVIFPPQLPGAFLDRLAGRLGVPRARLVDAQDGLSESDRRDLYTSSVPYALRHAADAELARPGDIGLILAVGSGLQAAGATYYF